MAAVDRGRIAGALVLILLGAWFLAVQLVPGLDAFAFNRASWPLAIVGAGLVLLIIGLATWVPGMLVPASIVGGIGALFYWQNATNNWGSWVYAWTLIPGFCGLGVLLMNLMEGKPGEALRAGGWLMFISLLMFLIFGSFLGGIAPFGVYWPLLIVALGVLLLGQAVLRARA